MLFERGSGFAASTCFPPVPGAARAEAVCYPFHGRVAARGGTVTGAASQILGIQQKNENSIVGLGSGHLRP